MGGETRQGLHDSGNRRTFNTGAQRDRDEGKIRPDLISPFSLRRVGRIMMLGAKKYSARNWEKGMPMSEFFASAERHRLAYLARETSGDHEDHLAQWAWNVLAMLHIEEVVRLGILPKELNDMPDYSAWLPTPSTDGESLDEIRRRLGILQTAGIGDDSTPPQPVPSTSAPDPTAQLSKMPIGRIDKAILGGLGKGDIFQTHFKAHVEVHGIVTHIERDALQVECKTCGKTWVVDNESYRRIA